MFFDRDYRFMIGKGGDVVPVMTAPFEFEFDVKKTLVKGQNYSRFKIKNVSREKLEKMIIPDQYLWLEAGYLDSGINKISSGRIIDGQIIYNGTEVEGEFVILEGLELFRDGTISVSMPENSTSDEVMREMAKQLLIPLNKMPEVDNKIFPYGFSFYGDAKKGIDIVCGSAAAQWSVQDDAIQVLTKGGNTGRTGYLISEDSGMKDHPSRQLESAKHYSTKGDKPTTVSKKGKQTGWEVTTVLIGKIQPGDLVQLQSKTVSGTFKVHEVHHRGAFSGNWDTTLTLVDPDNKSDSDVASTAGVRTTDNVQQVMGNIFPLTSSGDLMTSTNINDFPLSTGVAPGGIAGGY